MSNFLENLVARSLSPSVTVRPQVLSIFELPPNDGAIFRGSPPPELPLVEHEIENPIAQRLDQLQSLRRGTTEEGAMAAAPLAPQSRAGTRSQSRPEEGTSSEKTQAGTFSFADSSPDVPAETPVAIKRKRAAIAPGAENVLASKRPNERNSHKKSLATQKAGTTSSAATPVTPARRKELARSSPPGPAASQPALMAAKGKRPDARPEVRERETREVIVRERHDYTEAIPAREASVSRIRSAPGARSVAPQHKILPVAPIVPASIVVSPRILPAPLPNDDATSIHVTIGRVEVRATTTTAPPKPLPKRPSVMSLDTYLRQRAGGVQR